MNSRLLLRPSGQSATDPSAYPLLPIVVGWAVFLFCGFGLMSRSNPMAFAALAVGAAAVSSAVYLIVDLSDPYSGLFQASSAPIERVMKDINNHEERWRLGASHKTKSAPPGLDGEADQDGARRGSWEP
jgi:hypothetical protein